MKHTPGPWKERDDETPWTEGDAEIAQKYGEPFGVTEVLFSIEGAGGETVAFCPWRGGDLPADQETLRANARLIAAAPDLLAAAELVEEAWTGNGDMSRAVDACLLAISKAKGDA